MFLQREVSSLGNFGILRALASNNSNLGFINFISNGCSIVAYMLNIYLIFFHIYLTMIKYLNKSIQNIPLNNVTASQYVTENQWGNPPHSAVIHVFKGH